MKLLLLLFLDFYMSTRFYSDNNAGHLVYSTRAS